MDDRAEDDRKVKRHGAVLPSGTIIRNLDDLEGTERAVDWGNGISYRFLVEKDGFPFGLHHSVILAGTENLLEYKRHIEACYCVRGEGEIEIDGKIYPIRPGTVYALKHDAHRLRASEDGDLHLVCVFSPPLVGDEVHRLRPGESSSY